MMPHLGDAIEVVPLPRLTGVDRPDPRDLPLFTERLTAAIETTLNRDTEDPEFAPGHDALEPFTWSSVFGRVERVWGA